MWILIFNFLSQISLSRGFWKRPRSPHVFRIWFVTAACRQIYLKNQYGISNYSLGFGFYEPLYRDISGWCWWYVFFHSHDWNIFMLINLRCGHRLLKIVLLFRHQQHLSNEPSTGKCNTYSNKHKCYVRNFSLSSVRTVSRLILSFMRNLYCTRIIRN